MGRDKASLRLRGRSLAEITEDALKPHCIDVHHLGPTGLIDVPNMRGPLAGILAAVRHAPSAWWVIAACDMPLLTPQAIAWLLERREADTLAVIPRTPDGQAQPTCALYGPGVEALLTEVTAPSQLVGKPKVLSPEIPEALADQWTNVNDPVALRRLSLT